MTKEALEAALSSLDTWIQVFAVLVAIGIVGEVGFGVRHWILNRRLAVIQHAEDLNQEQIIAGLNHEAGEARKTAGEASERAAKAEGNVAEANERAANALKAPAEAKKKKEEKR